MACAAKEAAEPPVRKLLVRHGKRAVDKARGLAGRGELEEIAGLDCAAGAWHRCCYAQDILQPSRESLPAVASGATVYFFARLNSPRGSPQRTLRTLR